MLEPFVKIHAARRQANEKLIAFQFCRLWPYWQQASPKSFPNRGPYFNIPPPPQSFFILDKTENNTDLMPETERAA